jgi:hypothetical protein
MQYMVRFEGTQQYSLQGQREAAGAAVNAQKSLSYLAIFDEIRNAETEGGLHPAKRRVKP